MKNQLLQNQRGFTLIEVIVSVGIFAIVMTISLGALFSVVGASRQSTREQTVVDTLSFALDSMKRDLALGSLYHCNATDVIDFTQKPTPRDCPSTPSSSIAFRDTNGATLAYTLSNGVLFRKTTSVGPPDPLTSSDLTINTLSFYVTGAETANDHEQPQVHMLLSGTASPDGRTVITFKIQTTITERLVDVNN